MDDKITPSPICPYCGFSALLITGAELYPHRSDLRDKRFWHCGQDGAWVGCHPGTTKPLGRLANAELRQAKQLAHAEFDPLWKTGQMSRAEAYHWLCGALGIPREETHIGMFDVQQCMATVYACRDRVYNARLVEGETPWVTR